MVGIRGFEPDPDNPGWLFRPQSDFGLFIDYIGEMRVRVIDRDHSVLRVMPQRRHMNFIESVHGGFIMCLVDQALFAGPVVAGVPGMAGGITIDASVQFVGALREGVPIDINVEILRETRKMVFVRGLMDQDGQTSVSFSATVKKARE